MFRETQAIEATTDAVSWRIFLGDVFNVPRIDLVFGSAPTTPGMVTVTKDSVSGSSYDSVIRTVNPVGLTSVAIEGMHGFTFGDALVITYANVDGVEVSGSATLEIPEVGSNELDGITISNGIVRSKESKYRRYYHINLLSADPASSGATYESPTANYLGGMRLNAATDVIQSSWDIHGDWDSSTNPVLEARVTNMIDNTGGAIDDIIKFKFVLYYSQPGIPGVRYQTFYAQGTVGQLAQYAVLDFSKEVDRNVTDNPILPGDSMYAMLNVEADSDIDDVIINHASFYYSTTHIGIEAEDL